MSSSSDSSDSGHCGLDYDSSENGSPKRASNYALYETGWTDRPIRVAQSLPNPEAPRLSYSVPPAMYAKHIPQLDLSSFDPPNSSSIDFSLRNISSRKLPHKSCLEPRPFSLSNLEYRGFLSFPEQNFSEPFNNPTGKPTNTWTHDKTRSLRGQKRVNEKNADKVSERSFTIRKTYLSDRASMTEAATKEGGDDLAEKEGSPRRTRAHGSMRPRTLSILEMMQDKIYEERFPELGKSVGDMSLTAANITSPRSLQESSCANLRKKAPEVSETTDKVQHSQREEHAELTEPNEGIIYEDQSSVYSKDQEGNDNEAGGEPFIELWPVD